MEMITFQIDFIQVRAMADIIWFTGYTYLTVWVWRPEWIKKLRFSNPNEKD